MESDGIEELVAATFDQPAATEESESPSFESADDASPADPLTTAPESGPVPEAIAALPGDTSLAAPHAPQTPDLAAQLAQWQQTLPQLIAQQVQQSLSPFQAQQQQQYNALAQAYATQQQEAQRRQAAAVAEQERTAFLADIGNAEPGEAMARLVSYFDQRQATRDAQQQAQQAQMAQAFRAYQKQQQDAQLEQENIGHVARHWQTQYGLSDDEARQLLEAPDPYQMGMQAQNIAYNRQLAALTQRVEHLTKHASVQQRVASGVDRVASANGAARGPRRIEDAQNDDELFDILFNG